MRTLLPYLLLIPQFAFGQRYSINKDTVYYGKYWDIVSAKDSATYFRPPIKKVSKKRYEVKDYYISTGNLQMKAVISLDGDHGLYTYYYENGKLDCIESYLNGRYHGDIIGYYKSGKIRRKETYKNGELVMGKCYTRAGRDTIYFADRSIPRFSNSDKNYGDYVYNSPIYKNFQKANKTTGYVAIRVFFDTAGRITNAVYVQKVHPSLDETAMLLVMTMPNWLPAEDEEGRYIESTTIVRIYF